MASQRSEDSQPASSPIVFLVDDDVSIRESVDLLIRWAGWRFEAFPTAEAFLARATVDAPSCLILDVAPPHLSGLDLQARLAETDQDMPIVFITRHGDIPMTVRAMRAGAIEFLTKPFTDDDLLHGVRRAIERSRAVRLKEMELRTLRGNYKLLSPRERQVMDLVVSGLLNKQIGGELGISEITVKAHRGQVMRKMRADSVQGLVRMAAKLSLPPETPRSIGVN
jgi:FixJ family two-component response regulator